MYGTEMFQIVHGEGFHVGELTPTGTLPIQRGTAMDHAADDPLNYSERGNNGKFLGFLSEKVVEEVTYEQLVLGGPDQPVQTGHKVTLIVLPESSEIEVEEADGVAYNASPTTYPGHLVTTGTGAIAEATALQTQLSVLNGRWYVAQAGDYVRGVLVGHPDPWTAGNIRVRIRLVDGALKP